MGVLWRMAGLPGEAPADPKSPEARAASAVLLPTAEWFLSFGRMTGEESAGLSMTERAALISAAQRSEARHALLLARAIGGGKGAAEVMAVLDDTAAESMLLDTIPVRRDR